MLRIIRERYRQGFRTGKFPRREPQLPPRFRGFPSFVGECPADCPRPCIDLCPFGACLPLNREIVGPGERLRRPGEAGQMQLDLGRCLFCADCPACPRGRIEFGNDYRLAVRRREDLLYGGGDYPLAGPLEPARLKLFGRSLKLRQVSAGGCNACEADCNVLGTPVFDLGRFGIQFVASPRHADAILLTGPVTENMRSAVLATHEAIPAPKIVIAAGACAIDGGPFRGSPEIGRGLASLLPVDLFIPGCPPHPYTLLDGLLRLLGRR